jgi:hypothetical protein
MTGNLDSNSQILVFSTSIDSHETKQEVLNFLNAHERIHEASLDLEDSDKVLRVVTDLCTDEIADLLLSQGHTCTELF